MHGEGAFANELRSLGIPIYSFSRKKLPPEYLWNLPLQLSRGRYDVVHFHLFGSNWIGKPFARLLQVPCIVAHDHCNDRTRQNPICLIVDRFTNQLADAILAVSSSTRNFLLTQEKLPAEKVYLVYNGIDTDEFYPLLDWKVLSFSPRPQKTSQFLGNFGIPSDAIVVGGVGRLNPQKNFHVWLQSAAKIRQINPEIWFLIAGDGPLREELKSFAKKFNLDNRVVFCGFVKERQTLFQAIDVLLLTSDYEGTPMTVLEAMATGVPVVCSNVDGPSEFLEDQRDSLLVPPGEPQQFSNAVQKLLANPMYALELAKSAREKVCKQFNAKVQCETILKIYQEILSQRKR